MECFRERGFRVCGFWMKQFVAGGGWLVIRLCGARRAGPQGKLAKGAEKNLDTD